MKRSNKMRLKLAARRKDYDDNMAPQSNYPGEYKRPGSLKLKG